MLSGSLAGVGLKAPAAVAVLRSRSQAAERASADAWAPAARSARIPNAVRLTWPSNEPSRLRRRSSRHEVAAAEAPRG